MDTFKDTLEYQEREEKFEQDKNALEWNMHFRLKERGRETAKYPDDKDLVKWYNDELEDLTKWFYRDIEDMERAFIAALNPRPGHDGHPTD